LELESSEAQARTAGESEGRRMSLKTLSLPLCPDARSLEKYGAVIVLALREPAFSEVVASWSPQWAAYIKAWRDVSCRYGVIAVEPRTDYMTLHAAGSIHDEESGALDALDEALRQVVECRCGLLPSRHEATHPRSWRVPLSLEQHVHAIAAEKTNP